MPRLFTAIEIPQTISQSLASHRGGLPGSRWMDQSSYHITLRFFGDVDNRSAYDIADLLGDVSRDPFTVELDGLGSFGGDRPRALYAGVVPSRPLMELQAEHERIARRCGLPAETRKFTPHVTLARLGGPASPREVADYLALQGHVPRRQFSIERFVLLSSRSSFGGGPYVIEEDYPLSARFVPAVRSARS
jgi:2'-5' RNA ligase